MTTPPSSLRQDILDTARELFATEGFGSVSLRKIAQRSGCTPMAIYCHFADKADILDCVCEETFTRLHATLDGIDHSGRSARQRLAAGMRMYIEFGLAHPHHYQLTFMTPPAEPLTLSRREQISRRSCDRMRSRVSECLEEDGEAVDAETVDVLGQTVWSATHGLTSLLIARPDFPWADRERLIDSVIATAISALRGFKTIATPAAKPPAKPPGGAAA